MQTVNMMLILLLSLFAWIGTGSASYFVVTAPNVIRFNQDETIVVAIFGGEKNYTTNIWLQIKQRTFSQKTVEVKDKDHPTDTTIKVTEADLFGDDDDDDDGKPDSVMLYSSNSYGQFSRKLWLSYDTGFIIVQTSKPIYQPDDEVKVRALALTGELKSAKTWNISLDIISPSNLNFGRKNKVNNDSFFQDFFRLPPHAEIGLWTVKAFFRGQYETQTKATFYVRKYVLPTFGVEVDVDEKIILPTTESITVRVRAKYVYNKAVDGPFYLELFCLMGDGNNRSMHVIDPKMLGDNGEQTVVLDGDVLVKLKARCQETLLVKARVIEKVTGDEEVGSYRDTIFSDKQYKFNFENSKRTFKPGLGYHFEFRIQLANGHKPGRVGVLCKWQQRQDKPIKQTTDADGRAVIIIDKLLGNAAIVFEVSIEGTTESTQFSVEPTLGSHLVSVDKFEKKPKEVVVTTTVGASIGGTVTMLLSRGRIQKYTKSKQHVLEEDVLEKLAPEGRAVAFFIADNGKMVADSLKFTEPFKCRDNGLSLDTGKSSSTPDKKESLLVKGSPFMDVGLNVMDKSLLLLDSENILRRNTIIKKMLTHDIGCDEGIGKNAGEALRDAGLTVLTNAEISSDSLERKKSCNGLSRSKRRAFKSVDTSCQKEIMKLTRKLKKEYNRKERIWDYDDIELVCYGEIMKLAKEKQNDLAVYKYTTSCIVAMYDICVNDLVKTTRKESVVAKSIFEDSSDYLKVLKEAGLNSDDLFIRKNFKDSWLFETLQLDNKGERNISMRFPSTITSWMFQAIGISDSHGVCIAEPQNVTVDQPFFLKLKLPYEAKRYEYLEFDVTIFNYVEEELKVDVFISGQRGLCTGAIDLEEHRVGKFNLAGNAAKNVRVPVLALEEGLKPIRIKAIGRRRNEAYVDAVEKNLLVVNEGVEEREVIRVCLNNVRNDTCENSNKRIISSRFIDGVQTTVVNLKPPENAIEGTASAFAYASSDPMENVVRTLLTGIDNMLRQPWGCGEQTMLLLGPSVYVMSYWKAKDRMTPEREQKGNKWIRDGVKRELTYRHSDGSYAAWQSRPSSTWLTAFVAKVFCQAKKVVDDAIQFDDDFLETIMWITSKQSPSGAFRDFNPVIHREMTGQIRFNGQDDPELTAFALIAILECDIRNQRVEIAKNNSQTYLEGKTDAEYRADHYLLAISTYALALANSKQKFRMRSLLLEQSVQRNGFMYWGNPGNKPANKEAVETTAYALLALLEYENGVLMVNPIVKWLNDQRSAAGSFRTTQDTVVGLQALSRYTIYTKHDKVDMSLNLLADAWVSRANKLTNENKDLLETIEGIPINDHGPSTLHITAEGEGTGELTIDYRYNRPETEHEKCAFDISDVVVTEVFDVDSEKGKKFNRTCDICGVCEGEKKQGADVNLVIDDGQQIKPRNRNDNKIVKNAHCITFSVKSLSNREHGMSIVDVGLETGVTVRESNLQKMKEDGLIDQYEMPDEGKGFFILYLNSITPEEQEFKFVLEDEFNGDKKSRKVSRIKVYDYYLTQHDCMKFYSVSGSGHGIQHTCTAVKGKDNMDKKTCTCMLNTCPTIDEDIIEQAKKKAKPVKKMAEVTCRPYYFAILVEVENLIPIFNEKRFIAKVKVEKLVHGGASANLQPGAELNLYWKFLCGGNLMVPGKKYFVITKDREQVKGVMPEFPVAGNAVVAEWREKNQTRPRTKARLLHFIMESYKGFMAKGCPN